MMMMSIGTVTLVTQLENGRSRVHATKVPATGQIYGYLLHSPKKLADDNHALGLLTHWVICSTLKRSSH